MILCGTGPLYKILVMPPTPIWCTLQLKMAFKQACNFKGVKGMSFMSFGWSSITAEYDIPFGCG